MATFRLKQTNHIINVARKVMADPTTPVTEIADRELVSRHSILHARTVLEHGTAQELMDVTTGKLGLTIAYRAIRDRMSPEEREKLKKRHAPPSTQAREKYSGEAAIWAKLGPALRGLSELPSPQDVIKVITAHKARETTVTQHLDAASNWMEEFVNAWKGYKSGRTVPENHSDAGDGGPVSGTQHAKSAA